MNTYYILVNRRTGQIVSGTDKSRNGPPRQMFTDKTGCPPKLFTKTNLESELIHRRINPKTYKVQKVILVAKDGVL